MLRLVGFNNSNRFSFLQKTVMELLQTANFTIYPSDKTYKVFEKTIQDFRTSQRIYIQAHNISKKSLVKSSQYEQSKGSSTVSGERGLITKKEVDSLEKSFLTFLWWFRKSFRARYPRNRSFESAMDTVWSYCKKMVCSAKRCSRNLDRDRKDRWCRKMEHSEVSHWSRNGA